MTNDESPAPARPHGVSVGVIDRDAVSRAEVVDPCHGVPHEDMGGKVKSDHLAVIVDHVGANLAHVHVATSCETGCCGDFLEKS